MIRRRVAPRAKGAAITGKRPREVQVNLMMKSMV
jgi:hypothetical protein